MIEHNLFLVDIEIVEYAIENAQVVGDEVIVRYEFIVDFFALGCDDFSFLSQGSLQLGFCLGGGDKVYPLLFGRLRFGGQDFDLVATLQFLAQRHQFMVDLGGDAVVTEVGVQNKRKVESRRIFGESFELRLSG